MSSSFDVFKLTDDDAMKFLVSESHIGTKKMDYQMEHNVWKRRSDGLFFDLCTINLKKCIHIINIRKTWEKLLFAVRAIAAIENPSDVVVVSAQPYAQRAVLKVEGNPFTPPIVGHFTPSSLTNQIQKNFKEKEGEADIAVNEGDWGDTDDMETMGGDFPGVQAQARSAVSLRRLRRHSRFSSTNRCRLSKVVAFFEKERGVTCTRASNAYGIDEKGTCFVCAVYDPNAFAADDFYDALAEMVLDMHKDIMCATNPLIAGDLRLTEIDVRDHSGVSAEEVPAKMAEFVAWFNSHEHTTDLLSLTAEVHYRLTFIHPSLAATGAVLDFHLILYWP
ncbi:hypothetical protein niasHS_004537 [Heterodera schachtii]|uniref:Fido domain-containing protein n=1 Tax=Heterodera schachtii TaxID=97005 RepID=A0ABD2JMH9_HETSC